MNQQIEELFSKIEMDVWRRKHSGDRLRESIAKVNMRGSKTETSQFLLRPRKEIMCPYILDGQKCTNTICPYAHYVTQIDLVKERQYTRNCENAIKTVTRQEDKIKEQWHPPAVPYEFATRSMQTIVNAEINQTMKEEKHIKKDEKPAQKGLTTQPKSANEQKKSTPKDIQD